MAEEQHDGDGGRGGDEILQNADAKHALAASDPFGSIVLPGEGGAGLAERVEHVVGDDFDVERGAGGAMTTVPRLLMAAWMMMLATANTALCTPAAVRCAESDAG